MILRYLELLRDLFSTGIDWYAKWKPTFDDEKEERKRAKAEAKAAKNAMDVPYEVINPKP